MNGNRRIKGEFLPEEAKLFNDIGSNQSTG
jgi:hypothetical protein